MNVLDGEPVLSDSPMQFQFISDASIGYVKTTSLNYNPDDDYGQTFDIYSIFLATIGGYFIGSNGEKDCNGFNRRFLTTGGKANKFAIISPDESAPSYRTVIYGMPYIIRGTGAFDTKYIYSCAGTSVLFWSPHDGSSNDDASTRLEFTILKTGPTSCAGDTEMGFTCPEEFACTVVADCGGNGTACINGICAEECTMPGNTAASVAECCEPLYYDGECVLCLPGGETKPTSMTAAEACCSEEAAGDVCTNCTGVRGSPVEDMPCCPSLYHNIDDDTCDSCVPNGQAPPEDMDECCGMNLNAAGECAPCAIAGTENILRESQCCSGLVLVDETCVLDEDGCLSADEDCSGGEDCCGDLVCTKDDDTDVSHCVPPPTPCGETDDLCDDVDDCCEGYMCGLGGKCKPIWYWGLYIGIIIGGLLLLAALVYAAMVLLKPKKTDDK